MPRSHRLLLLDTSSRWFQCPKKGLVVEGSSAVNRFLLTSIVGHTLRAESFPIEYVGRAFYSCSIAIQRLGEGVPRGTDIDRASV